MLVFLSAAALRTDEGDDGRGRFSQVFLLLAAFMVAASVVLYSARAGEDFREGLAAKAVALPEAGDFLQRHPGSRQYVLSVASAGLSNALSGKDSFFGRYEADPLVQAARNGSASFRGEKTPSGSEAFEGSSAVYVVSVSPNPPVQRAGWIAPHPDRPVLFVFFSGNGFMFSYEAK